MEPFISDWALDDFQTLNRQRFAAGMSGVQAFYHAAASKAEEMIVYPNAISSDETPMEARTLNKLLLSLANVTLSVEHHAQLAPGGTEHNPAVQVIRGPTPA